MNSKEGVRCNNSLFVDINDRIELLTNEPHPGKKAGYGLTIVIFFRLQLLYFGSMNLHGLTTIELNQLLLKTNDRYLPFLLEPSEVYKNDPYFLYIREELRNILIELERRNETRKEE